MRFLRFFLIVLLLLAPATAQDWQLIFHQEGVIDIFLDVDSVEITGDSAVTRQKFEYTAPSEKGSYALLTVTIRKNGKFRVDHIDSFDPSGKLVSSRDSTTFVDISPNSPIEIIYGAIFKQKSDAGEPGAESSLEPKADTESGTESQP